MSILLFALEIILTLCGLPRNYHELISRSSRYFMNFLTIGCTTRPKERLTGGWLHTGIHGKEPFLRLLKLSELFSKPPYGVCTSSQGLLYRWTESWPCPRKWDFSSEGILQETKEVIMYYSNNHIRRQKFKDDEIWSYSFDRTEPSKILCISFLLKYINK